MLTIDGSMGEGGGQILRSALALSLVTSLAFRITNIRRGRAKPGLMRQHLAAVRGAATIGAAEISGDVLHGTELEFRPGSVRGGAHSFATGGAGSTTLVFQTVLYPLLLATDVPSTLRFEGGTHNPMAPPFDFLEGAFLPQLARMGGPVPVVLERCGFFPAGGGEWSLISSCSSAARSARPARGRWCRAFPLRSRRASSTRWRRRSPGTARRVARSSSTTRMARATCWWPRWRAST